MRFVWTVERFGTAERPGVPSTARAVSREPAAHRKPMGPWLVPLLSMTPFMFAVFDAGLLLAAVPSQAAHAPAGDQQAFELPADSILRDLGKGETHVYRVFLTEGQYLQVSVSQPVGDLVISVSGPDVSDPGEFDSHQREPERVRIVARASGTYQLEVRSLGAANARYELKLEELRGAEPRDEVRLTAERAATQAKRLRFQGGEQGRRQATESLQKALSLWRELGDEDYVGRTLNDLGVLYSQLGEVQDGLTALEESLALRRALGDRRGEASTLHNLGAFHRVLGDADKALAHFRQALELRRIVGDRWGEEKTLHNIGGVYQDLGDKAKALAHYEQALSIQRELGADRSGLALTLDDIGSLCLEVGEREKALRYFSEALAASREAGDRHAEALTLHRIGSAYALGGDRAKALMHYDQALKMRRAMGNWLGELESLYRIALALREEGDLEQARVRVEEALSIVEGVRAKVASQSLRAAYMASSQSHYELAIDVLMGLHRRSPGGGFEALALAMAERGRARSLLDTLAEASVDVSGGADGELLGREVSLRRRIAAKEQHRAQLLSEGAEGEAAEAEKEVAALLAEYESLQGEMRSRSPRYAALTQPRPYGLGEIQGLLDEASLLLEYDLGEERSYLWAVTRGGVWSHELPKRSEVEALARRVYESMVTSRERGRRVQAELAALELSRMVLGPVSERLGERRLLIVADGALQYVPFGALPRPDRGDVPLIVGHEVVSLPSASVVGALREETLRRSSAGKAVAVLADPVLRREDSRVKGRLAASTRGEDGGSEVLRSAVEVGAGGLPRLLFTRREAETIASMASGGGVLKALDFQASRATATRPELREYRIVHFATHGLLNSQHPELSGIVLSLVDEEGGSQDGFLRLQDLYNMRLGADLVVLSGCQTALGKEIKGEGLVGLTRGFMYAGAPRVVASLWSVRDEATSELMKRFYRGMLRRKLTPPAALRAAQVSMWKDPRWKAPYFWAAFVLQGEWK